MSHDQAVEGQTSKGGPPGAVPWSWVHRQVNPLLGYSSEHVRLEDKPADGRVLLVIGNGTGLPKGLMLTPAAAQELADQLHGWVERKTAPHQNG